jgi:oligopeptidase A
MNADAAALNPLLDTAPLPAFDRIAPAHVAPALDVLLADAEQALERAAGDAVPADYEAMSAALDVPTERLGVAWRCVSHLNAVADTPELRCAFADNLARVTAFHTRLGADQRLYRKYRAIDAHAGATGLSPARRQALTHALRDFVLGGAELEGAARLRHAEIDARLAELSQQFSQHVLDATDGFACYVSEDELGGVPADVREAARAAAAAEGRDGCKLTLHMPSYYPVMQYAGDRALRERLYRAYATRASEFGPAALDNGPLMQEILTLRQEQARLLGHASFAELSLVPKMAGSPAQVTAFLRDLARRARPQAERDLAELRDFARRELGLPDLQAWDMAYASERLRLQRYAFSAQEVRQYFTLAKVLAGLFRVIETLFEVSIREASAPAWHPSVRFFRIERGTELVGSFFLDLYARPGKRPGAWMDEVRGRWARPGGRLQLPVANLVCDFTPPQPAGDGATQDTLLSHDDVTTLFHEFGHGLHHLLTRVEDIGVAGLSGVEWDACELPSQFMENFCWEWAVVEQLSAHADTQAALPRELFERMLAARNFQSGLHMVRHVELALADMRLHAEPGSEAHIQDVIDEVRREVAVFPTPDFNRHQNAFMHIFDGGYAAGYYSYKWAEVLSADAWSAFEESDVLDVATGRRYREAILEAGGSRPALESFKAFRGREPSIDALLRHQGIA